MPHELQLWLLVIALLFAAFISLSIWDEPPHRPQRRRVVTFAPQALQDLEVYWSYHHGVNLGVVGDAAHAARSSYHNGWDVASGLAGSTDMATVAAGDYSYRLARDKIKSNAASAIDLGKLNGSLVGLQDFSRWLVTATKGDATKYRDVREIIYSPDGKVVKRWDNNAKVLYAGGDGTGQGDNSHLYHTHISFFRDSEARDKRPLFSPYFDPPLPDSSTGDPMLAFKFLAPAVGTVTVKGAGHALIRLSDGKRYAVPDGEKRESFAKVSLLTPLDTAPGDRSTCYLIGAVDTTPATDPNVEAAVLLATDVTYAAAPVAAPTPHTVTLLLDGTVKATVTV